MKYKVGDRVQIKSIDWYNENKDADGIIDCGVLEFDEELSAFCGKIVTLNSLSSTNAYDRDCYTIMEDNRRYNWTDEMFEGLVEEETKPGPKFKVGDKIKLKSTLLNDIFGVIGYEPEGYRITNISNGLTCFMSYSIEHYYELVEEEAKPKYEDEVTGEYYSTPKYLVRPSGYQFVDENGNAINATKISLRKKKEVIPNLQLDSIRTVREYDTAHSRIWLEIYEDNPKVCIFTHLLVDEDYRRKGYGTKALEQAEIISKDLGCDTIHLKVETDSWMHEWYLRSGYKFLTNAEDNYTWLTKSI